MDFVTVDLGLFESGYFECVKCFSQHRIVQREAEKRQKLQQKGHGEYREVWGCCSVPLLMAIIS